MHCAFDEEGLSYCLASGIQPHSHYTPVLPRTIFNPIEIWQFAVGISVRAMGLPDGSIQPYSPSAQSAGDRPRGATDHAGHPDISHKLLSITKATIAYSTICLESLKFYASGTYNSRDSVYWRRRRDKMQHDNWQCPKCQNKEFETDHFAATGGGITKFLNIQNKNLLQFLASSASTPKFIKPKQVHWAIS